MLKLRTNELDANASAILDPISLSAMYRQFNATV